jgi:hypothetical protein
MPKTSSNSVPPLIKSHSPEHSVPCSQQANSPQRIQQAHSQYHSAQQIPQCIEILLTAKCNGSRPIQLAQQYSPQHPSPSNGAHIPFFPVPYSSLPTHAITSQPPPRPPSFVPPLIFFYHLGIFGLLALHTPPFYNIFIDLLNCNSQVIKCGQQLIYYFVNCNYPLIKSYLIIFNHLSL